jgi:hypothetical protein
VRVEAERRMKEGVRGEIRGDPDVRRSGVANPSLTCSTRTHYSFLIELTESFSKPSCVRIISLFLYSKLFWIGRNVEDAMRDVGSGEARE